MLTLERIRGEILDLMKSCETSPEQAQSGIKEIFYLLMCSDQPFYLIYSKDAPLLSPTASDEKNLYLRLFSHEEVAKKYSLRTNMPYKAHSLLDILQIGRWAFWGGVYGFILNEGDRWIRISIPEFLSLFFTRIYGDASLCEQDCIEAVSFINEVRRNGSYHYGLKLSDAGKWTGEVQPGLLPPLTIFALFNIPSDNLWVEKDGGSCAYMRTSLLKALSLCGYSSDSEFLASGDHYEDEPLLLPSFSEGKWRVSEPVDLALMFEPTPVQESDGEESPVAETETNNTSAESVVRNPAEGKWKFLTLLREKLRKKPAGKNDGQEREPEAPNTQAQELDAQQELDSTPAPEPVQDPEMDPGGILRNGTAPEEPVSDPFADGPGTMSTETLHNGEKGGKKKLSPVLPVILGLVLLIGGIFVIRYVQYKENLKSFRAYIAAQNYANAYVLYQDAKFGSDADEYLTEEVDGLVLRYARNEISAEELSASLKALSNFSSLSQEIEIAKLTASKLEESKNAYVIGKETTDIYERLNIWRQVVQLDTVNYTAVQQAVEDNESRYVDVLRADIEYYRTRILDFAADRVDILAYWYPENEYVPALVKEFASVQSAPLSYYPISISDIFICQEANSYWTLYVRWDNLSVKTIKSICFSVVALGEDGLIVTCGDTQGEWTIFDAVDQHQYEPGEAPSFEKYYWNGAFYGPDVRNVWLTAVNIEYRDGSSASYTSDIDLDSIMTH